MKTYILSGGNSSRMGEDKGLKPLNGKPLIAYILTTAQSLGLEIKIIANSDGYAKFNTPVIPDKIKNKGPMGGIYTALCDAGEDVLILSADTPLIPREIISTLIWVKFSDFIHIVRYNDKIQPLCGIYPYSILKILENRIESSRLKMMELMDEVPTKFLNEKGKIETFINVNTPEDFTFVEIHLQNEN